MRPRTLAQRLQCLRSATQTIHTSGYRRAVARQKISTQIEEAVGTGRQHIADTRTLNRLRLATAGRRLSSSSLFPFSRAGTRSSSGMQPLTVQLTSSVVLMRSRSLTRELEKKFSDRHVLIVASRRILPRPKRSNRSRSNQTQKRPRSRTLTAVHDNILQDLVFPVEIVGKRIRTREDGSKVLKIILDEKERGGVDYRLDTYSEVYKRLTGKGVNFEFPQTNVSEY